MEKTTTEIVERPATTRELDELVISNSVLRRIREGNIPASWTPRPVTERPYVHERVVRSSDLYAQRPILDDRRQTYDKPQGPPITEATLRDHYTQSPSRGYELPPVKKG